MRSTNLGCDVIAILSDHSFRSIGVLAHEISSRIPRERLQAELDRLVVEGEVKRHCINGVWLYSMGRSIDD